MGLQSKIVNVQMMWRPGANISAGWVAAPVPVAAIVSVIVLAQNPDVTPEGFSALPRFHGMASEVGPNSPNGSLNFLGDPDIQIHGPYGVLVWYNE